VRALLDTDVVVAAVLFPGSPRSLLERAIRGDVDLVTSPGLLEELERALTDDLRFPPELARMVRAELEDLSEVIGPAGASTATGGPDDDPVLATAAAGGADAIVTGDPDLLALEVHRGTPILAPAGFWSLGSER